MFENLGTKIKTYAVVTFWIAAISIIVFSVYLIMKFAILAGVLLAVFGLLVCYIETIFVASLGELLMDMKANERNTAEIRRLLAEGAAVRNDSETKVVYVNSVSQTASQEKNEVIPVAKKARVKPEPRKIGINASQTLKLLDKGIRFKFPSDEACMGWMNREIAKLPDGEKSKTETLIKFIDNNDVDGFIDEYYKLYNNID